MSQHQRSSSPASSCLTTSSCSTRTGPPVSFLIHRILRILESSKTVIRLSVLETQLVRDLLQLQQTTTTTSSSSSSNTSSSSSTSSNTSSTSNTSSSSSSSSSSLSNQYQQYDLRGDVELLRALECNPRVNFNRLKNELSYLNPFEHITSEIALLHRIRYASTAGGGGADAGGGLMAASAVSSAMVGGGGGSGGGFSSAAAAAFATAGMAGAAFPGCGLGGLYGLKVTTDLLSGHPDMKTFIRNLLVQRKVRAIRPLYLRDAKVKCSLLGGGGGGGALLPAGSSSRVVGGGGEGCSLYDKEKCRECYENLKGCFLYSLGEEEAEEARKQLDGDLSQAWLGVKLPEMEEILEEQNVVVNQRKYKWMNPTAEERKALVMLKRKRRRMEQKQGGGGAAGAGKLRKIQNTHLFTPQQMRLEMIQQQ
eukprot:GHVS01091904.1.p1 GENE.GHVS01091904.1~~GHVS01091904.1.p1  ORF type:complete len:447 (+),score=148.37 GHVS01091904.1:77-1342(+)